MKQFFHCSWQVRTLLLLCLTLPLPFVEGGGGSLTPSASAQQNTIRIGNVNSLKELIRQIEVSKTAILSAQNQFEQVVDPTLIDCYIYELNAAQLRYQFLLRRFKNLEAEA